MDGLKLLTKALFILLIGFISLTAFAEESHPVSPVGYWKTIDDVTGKTKSIVQIYQADNQLLIGKIIKIFPSQGKDEHEVCAACLGNQHNQPIVGMFIMTGLKANKSQWDSGKILNPDNGKTYNCSVKLANNGQHLTVRGFVGLPLLGRTQTWERVDLLS